MNAGRVQIAAQTRRSRIGGGWRWRVMLVAAIGLCGAGLGAESVLADCDDDCSPASTPSATQPGCECDHPDFESLCNLSRSEAGPRITWPLHINLWQGFGPMEYPPRKLDTELSSACLVSQEGRHFRGPNPHRERPTHHDVMDLITGMPLVQEQDFELPFGGATFRHIRTYSENVHCNGSSYAAQATPSVGTFWDWNGRFWMMSENPILLIDANYPYINYMGPRRCYFIPDAHHAIPFEWDADTASYVAPPWFDATLAYSADAVLDEDGRWINPPSEWYVWLNRRSVKYTIQPYYEDLWVEQGYDIHDAFCGDFLTQEECDELGFPIQSYETLGIPYYGLVTHLEDRYGNRVAYDYCHFHQYECDYPETEQCVECCQNCNEKGQLKAIKLYTAENPTEAAWTLAYAHREFGGTCDGIEGCSTNDHMLHSIHVYKGDRPLPGGCLTIPGALFEAAQTLDEVDAIDAVTFFGFPDDWLIEAKYLYEENASPWSGYGLFKTSVTKRQDLDGAGLTEFERTHQIYKYQVDYRYEHCSTRGLNAVFDSETIDAIIEAGGFDVNDLLGLELDDTVDFVDPDTGEVITRSLGSLADLLIDERSRWEANEFGGGSADEHLIDNFIGLDNQRTWFHHVGKEYLVDRRADAEETGTYFYYYFMHLVDPLPTNPRPLGGALSHPYSTWGRLFHYPYRYVADSAWQQPPYDEPLWITVIDELEPGHGYDPEQDQGIRTRRVVEMNPAGYVLFDRTWSFEHDGSGQLIDQSGYGDVIKYDCRGRPIQKRGKGWSIAADPDSPYDPATEGLVEVYEYQDDACPAWDPGRDACDCAGYAEPDGPMGEMVAEGIQRGSSWDNPVYHTALYERHPDRPELITKETRFAESSGQTLEETYWRYVLGPPDPDDWKGPILEKTTIRGAAAQESGGTEYHAVEAEVNDDNGEMVWRGYGAVELADPAGDPLVITPDNAAQFYMDHVVRDDDGDPHCSVIDFFAAGFDPGLCGIAETPEPPAGWQRVALTPPLNSTTTYEYDDLFGLKRVTYPNGREMHIVWVQLSLYEYEQWKYEDVVWPDGPGSPFKVLSPVTITTYDFGQIESVVRVELTATDLDPNADEPYEVIAVTTPEYDENGRISGLSVEGADGDTAAAALTYVLGDKIGRQRLPDGTITRNVYDERGRLQKVYRGTRDQHEFWGTGVPIEYDPPGPEPCDPLFENDDNLMLVEKRYYGPDGDETEYYGKGVFDAGELVLVREYRNLPSNQYFEWAPPECDQPLDNNEDGLGWLTVHRHDWRMREVFVRRQQEDGTPISHTLTWYDHLDRQRYQVDYGPVAPDGGPVDPRHLAADSTLPTAGDILSASPAPLALTEFTYNARGQIEETRQYNVGVTDGSSYTVNLTFYNHEDKAVEIIGPNAPVQRFVYDATGRPAVTLTVARTGDGDLEMLRQESSFEVTERLVATTDFERLHDTAEGELNQDNSVQTFKCTWYAYNGDEIARAEFGTNSAAYLVNGSAPVCAPDEPPADLDDDFNVTACHHDAFGNDVQITCLGYDENGKENALYHPDGTVTRTEFSDLGRRLLVVENADDPDPAKRRLTAYYYEEETGRLTRMADVDPGHNGGVNTHSDIQWDAADGTLQVTEVLYDAEVLTGLDSGGGPHPLSAHGGWVSEIRYPDPETGSADPDQAIRFKYYADGTVAEQTDARGNVLTHLYDELGRRRETLVDDSAWYAGPQESPGRRVSRLTYDYTADGKPELVTTYERGLQGEDLATQNRFAYDHRLRNLEIEWQAHEGAVDPANTPNVQYAWDFASLDAGNYNRPVKLVYPPKHGAADGRSVTLDYGNGPGDLDSRANRITRIVDSVHGVLAEYTYAGLARRVASALGNGVTQTFEGAGGYTGLDRFGRPVDLHYRNAAQDTVHRYEYGFDERGNRLFARITQRPFDGPHENDRSYLYEYDELQRLVAAHFGMLDAANEAIRPDRPRAETTWQLDPLGNWSGGDPALGSVIERTDGDGNGAFESVRRIHHQVNERNELQALSDTGSVSLPDVVFYVDDDAGGGNDGSSWADAFTDLQDALEAAELHGGAVHIYVAKGIYRPDGGTVNPKASFALASEVALYGGFAGVEVSPAQRDIAACPTVLSGDLGGENSFHILTAADVDSTCVLDGFIISDGRADDWHDPYSPYNTGGGLKMTDSSPVIRNCTWVGNLGEYGAGAIYARGGSPTIANCLFMDNTTGGYDGNGGAIAISDYYPGSETPVITNCLFLNNSAATQGGAIDAGVRGLLTVSNCVFSGNASRMGGALYVGGRVLLSNSTLYANHDSAIFHDGDGLTVHNCILWGNTGMGSGEKAQIYVYDGTTPVVESTLLEGWTGQWGGEGNSGDDPHFVDPDGPDGTPGTLDDDLHLLDTSPGIDSANNGLVVPDTADLDQDGDTTEPVPFDLDGLPRIVDIVDRGAYEWPAADPASEFVYDPSGNLVFDGDHIHLYDALNRLVQVNEPGTARLNDDGRVVSGELGAAVARYTFDGLGRLVRMTVNSREEDYYYDGIRRIQEVIESGAVLKPIGTTSPALKETPGDGTTDSKPGLEPANPNIYIGKRLISEREYVYGPDYVDEFVAQIAPKEQLMYMLQDGNYNVVALLNTAADVLAQYSYTPYGRLRAVENLMKHAGNKVGHQGLFFERFGASEGLAVGADGLYYNRCRMYDPRLARFMQRDPHGTALKIITALAVNGQTQEILSNAIFDLEDRYADGLNYYQYLRSNPTSNLDPLGGFTLPSLLSSATIRAGLTSAALWYVKSLIPSIGDVLQIEGYVIGAVYGYIGFGMNGAQSTQALIDTLKKFFISQITGKLMTTEGQLAMKLLKEAQSLDTVNSLIKFATDKLMKAFHVEDVFSGLAAGLAAPAVLGASMYAGLLDYMMLELEYDTW